MLTVTAPFDLDSLRAQASAGTRFKYLFFWGHTPGKDGRLGQECLSQWYPAPFVVDGQTFATAEHFMMWSKARLFGDHTVAEQVLHAKTPGEAKKLGRAVQSFDEAQWVAARYSIVLSASLAKFGQNAELLAFLHRTGDKILVEASPTDRIWGIGLAADAPSAQDPSTWNGLNLLGFALMQARTQLKP